MGYDYSKKPVSEYLCKKIEGPLVIDGDLTKPQWAACQKSRRFGDVIDGAPGVYDTRAGLLWDDSYLYVGFWCEEPFLRGEITQRDSLIFRENDVEVFIDGGDTYYEFELNALNTIYEVFYIWRDAYQKGGRYDIPEFDFFAHNALTFGGNHDRSNDFFWDGAHPRGQRLVYRDWDLLGLKTAVKLYGELGSDTPGGGWTAEIAFPWSGMKWLRDGKLTPPTEDECMRLFLGRYEILHLSGKDVQVGWSLDEIGTMDNHAPERFTTIRFTEK